jgi:hypothetical protein
MPIEANNPTISGSKASAGLDAAREVEIVVDLLHGFRIGKVVEELQRADPGLHRVRRRNVGRNLAEYFGAGWPCAHAGIAAATASNASVVTRKIRVIRLSSRSGLIVMWIGDEWAAAD